MTRGHHKNTIHTQGNMAPPEPRHATTAGPGYSNTGAAQENNLKSNFIETLKEEMNKSFKEIQENTNKQVK